MWWLMVVAALAVAGPAGAQESVTNPNLFGIARSTPIEKLGHQRIGARSFRLTAVPRPHPSLNEYVAMTLPDGSICAVIGARSRLGNNDRTALFDDLSSSLKDGFGEPLRLSPNELAYSKNGVTATLSLKPSAKVVAVLMFFSPAEACQSGANTFQQ